MGSYGGGSSVYWSGGFVGSHDSTVVESPGVIVTDERLEGIVAEDGK